MYVNPDYNIRVPKEERKDKQQRTIKRSPASSEKAGIERETTERMTQEVKKVSAKEIPVISPARKIAGKRVYHIKRDILPWITNMFESGRRSNVHIYQLFENQIKTSNLTDEEKKSLLEDATRHMESANQQLVESMKRILESPELSEDLHSELLPNKEVVHKYKEFSKSVQKSIHDNIKGFIKNLEKVEIPHEDLQKEISLVMKDVEKNVANIEGLKRFEIIHEDEFWNPEHTTKRYMSFSNEQLGTSILGVSTFQAVGPGYSSQAPRNRTADNAFAANFVRSTYSVKPEKSEEEPEKVLEVTRSAITVEFDQPNAAERKKCNEALVKQVITAQLEHRAKGMSEEEILSAQDPQTPLLFKGQTVNLLTPDVFRTLARDNKTFKEVASWFYEMTGAPADDERSLMLENIEAFQALDGKILPFTVRINGVDQEIYLKLDLRYFNIPNNTLYIKMPSYFTESEEVTSANMSAWGKLAGDAKQNITRFTQEIEKKQKTLSSAERKKLHELMRRENTKNRLRQQIVGETIAEGKESSERQFAHWQKLADEVTNERKTLDESHCGPELKKILKILKRRSVLTDLYFDTEELFLSGLSTKVKNMDNNRSALATRIILLGALVEDIEVHFGCRSGKDRTGLVDVELKLLLTEAELNGRIPSYREEERLPEIINHRETMTLESGNSFDFVKANLGANLGLNTGGSASDPFEKNEAGMQYQELTQAVQAFASMASRPPTNWQVPPAKFEIGG